MAGRKRIPQPAADGPQEGSGPLDEEVLLPDDVEGLYKPFDYKIAKLAWKEGLASNTILDKLRWPKTAANITKVRRALERAAHHGLLELKEPPNKQLEKQLRNRFTQLQDVHVQVDRAAACHQAARLVAEEIDEFLLKSSKERMVIANAGGRTVRDIVSCLQRRVPVPPTVNGKQLVFVSLNAAEAHDQFDLCANFLSVRLAQIYEAEKTQHFAVVKPWDERTANSYQALLEDISLVISSAGGRDGFLSRWLDQRHDALPDAAVGDVAFHLLDKKGHEVALGGEVKSLVEEGLARAPSWCELAELFNKNKVLLVLAGAKLGVCRALLAGAWTRRCVVDAPLALEILGGVGVR